MGSAGWASCCPDLYPRPLRPSLTRPQCDPHSLRCQLGGPLAAGAMAERLILQHLLPTVGLLQLLQRAAPSQQLFSPGTAPRLSLSGCREVLRRKRCHGGNLVSPPQNPSPAPSLQSQPLLTPAPLSTP